MPCEDGMHNRVTVDRFAQIPGVKRYVPGDCWCLDCKQPLPWWYNRGHPYPAEDAEDA